MGAVAVRDDPQDAAEEEQALHLQQHPREEDVLRPLLELLGRRERFHKAQELRATLCHTTVHADAQHAGGSSCEPSTRLLSL